jgi:NAD(P)-dependent dehydrogenase (short-subunit alcohol dehydrogenase family)
MTSKGAEPSTTAEPPTLSPAAAEREKKATGPYWMDITRKLPMVPPRAMAAIEGWGYDSLGSLQGQVFIVTGGTSGIGAEASRELAKKGAHVIIAAPDVERSEAALQEMRRSTPDMLGFLEYIPLDLSSLQSIRHFVTEFLSRNVPLHALLCNAALQLRDADKIADGMEQRWGTNFVGHFYLAHLLLNKLGQHTPSRIVFQSSMEEQMGTIPWDDPLGMNPPPGADWYSSSKLANLMAGLEMARRLQGTQLDVFVVHPGVAQTDIFHKYERHPAGSMYRQMMQAVGGQSAYRGALPLVYAATEPSLQGKGGQFIGPRYSKSNLISILGQVYSFASLTPINKEAKSPHARFRIYEQTADALESLLQKSLPNRLRGVPLMPHIEGAVAAAGGHVKNVEGGVTAATSTRAEE